MNYTAIDFAQSLLALALYGPLLLCPGYALASAIRRDEPEAASGTERLLEALVVALALLPLLDSMAVRFLGLNSALALNLVLAGIGLLSASRGPRPKIGPAAWMLVLFWTGLALLLTVDIDLKGQLFQSTPAIDMVKHAATVRSIVESGAPPVDPFFAREGRSGYYYFFYTLPALAVISGAGWLEPRGAVAGLIVWTGIGLFGLSLLTMRWTGLGRGISPRRLGLVLVALLFATGLDVLPVLIIGSSFGIWVGMLEWWNEQVTSWFGSLIWVPHHVSALIASWLALSLLAREAERSDGSLSDARPAHLAIAALALASSFGLSVWVTIGAAVAACAWVLLLGVERRWRAVLAASLAGLASLLLALPALADLLSNRAYGVFPIAPTIRAFFVWDIVAPPPSLLNLFGRFLLLPVNYAIEFGIFLIGTVAYWTDARNRNSRQNEAARMLTITAVAGLLVGTFARSAILSNDLAWRVVLFPQLAALAWTANVVASGRLKLFQPVPGKAGAETAVAGPGRRLTPAGLALIIGYLAITYDVLALRALRAKVVFQGADPAVTRELRTAYEWMNGHVPASAVLQHNPTLARVYSFGLYSRHRVGVADHEAELFGASREAVYARVEALGPIFNGTMPVAAVRAAAAANGIDYLVVTADDPVWAEAGSWVQSQKPVYATDRLRVIRVADLATP